MQMASHHLGEGRDKQSVWVEIRWEQTPGRLTDCKWVTLGKTAALWLLWARGAWRQHVYWNTRAGHTLLAECGCSVAWSLRAHSSHVKRISQVGSNHGFSKTLKKLDYRVSLLQILHTWDWGFPCDLLFLVKMYIHVTYKWSRVKADMRQTTRLIQCSDS